MARANLTSPPLLEAWQDFFLSRQAMLCTPATLEFYEHTARRFLAWCEAQALPSPTQITARHVRQYLAKLAQEGKADTTIHDHARGIRTLLRFLHTEGHIPAPVTFVMPKLAKKRLPVLSADQVKVILSKCDKRDKAIVLFMVDSGVRRGEIVSLNWGDIDFASGLVRVKRGKGNKSRSAVIGSTTRRALLAYRRTLKTPPNQDTPLFLSRLGDRLTPEGYQRLFKRIRTRTGITVTAHALRRTFVILCLRSGMDVLHLQAMLGHASLEMVQHYAGMVDDDLLQGHRQHSPIDNLDRLKGGDKDS